MSSFRIRQAPSPTGYLHLGTTRQILFTKLFAKVNHGTYFLRLEDTDRNRLHIDAAKNLLKTLQNLYLLPDEGITINSNESDKLDQVYGIYQIGDYGPYIQSERLKIYQEHAQNLIDQKLAYWSYLTEPEIEELQQIKKTNKRPINYFKKNLEKFGEKELFKSVREGLVDERKPALKYHIQRDDKIKCKDELVGESEFDLSLEEDFNILKSDGFPTYHLAHLVDDYLMGTTLVFRAQEWYPSIARHQTMFMDYWGDGPKYLHIPFILGETGNKKMSKRDGNVNMQDYLDKGYLPEAILNYLAFLGWNPGTEQELYLEPEDFRTLDQESRVEKLMQNIAKEFSIDKLSRAPARFNLEKLNWFNREYIKMLTLKEFAYLADKNRLDQDVTDKNMRVGDYVYLVDSEEQKVFMTSWENSVGDGNFYPIGGGREGDNPLESLKREVEEESMGQIELDKSKPIPITPINVLRPFKYLDGSQWDGKQMHFYFYPLKTSEIKGQILPDSGKEWDYQWYPLIDVIKQNKYITFPIWLDFCARSGVPCFEPNDEIVRYYLAYLLDKNRVTVLSEIGSDSDCILHYHSPSEADLKWKKISLEESLANLKEILEFIQTQKEEMIPKQQRLYEAVCDHISNSVNSLSDSNDSLRLEKLFFEITQEWETRIKKWLKAGNYDVGSYLWPLRVHLSGKTKSPSPFELLSILNRR